MSEVHELEVLFPDREVTVRDPDSGAAVTLTVREFRFREGLEVTALARPLIAALAGLVPDRAEDEGPDALAIESALAAHAALWLELAARASSRDAAWLARLAARRAITEPLAAFLFGALPGLFGGAGAGADAFRRLQAGVGHQGAIAGQLGGVSRTVPAGVFALAPRFHSGGVAGLRPDGGIAGLQPGEVPIIAQQGETILPRGTQVAAPSIEINFENRGTPQREVSREVRLDPRGMIVTVVTEDLDNGGPASQAIARRFGLRNAVA